MKNRSYETNRAELNRFLEISGSRLKSYARLNNRFSAVRLGVFVAGLTATIYSFTESNTIGWIVLLVFLSILGIVVHLHNKHIEGIRRLSFYRKIQEEDLARLEIDWEKLPGFYSEESDGLDDIERDLDLYGNRSLHCIIDNTVSIEGSTLLRKSLHGSFPGLDELNSKQALVRELSVMRRMRKRFLLRARMSSGRKLDCAKTMSAFEGNYSYKLPSIVFGISIILALALYVMILMMAVGIYEGPVVTVLMANLFVYFAFAGKVNKSLEKLNDIEPYISKLYSMISILSKAKPGKNSELVRKFPEYFSECSQLNRSFTNLRKISSAASFRENSIMRILLNVAFPYDFLIQRSFDSSTKMIASNIGDWLHGLNELECLIALANYADLNPDYTYPTFDDKNENVFRSEDMVHPLMKRNVRRTNNFSLNKENEIVIVTGSNMSGKSTFLRTVGINLCLAYAGAPTACSFMRTSEYNLFTCIKVSDSVFDGISYFYAEVKRLRLLLDILEKNAGPKVFFFIDEIFKGTNNRERLKGSMSFLKKIASMNCTGFVTTHDLELVHLSDSLNSIVNYHFRENISEGEMTFEYKIHPGPCPTTNALEIMRLNGLPVDD